MIRDSSALTAYAAAMYPHSKSKASASGGFNSSSLQAAAFRPVEQAAEVKTKVNLSVQGQLKQLGQRYDVTHMSDLQMKQLAGELKDNNLISEWEYANMTLVVKPIHGNYDASIPKDFLNQYQAQTDFARQYSTLNDTKMLEHLSGLLNTLHQLHT